MMGDEEGYDAGSSDTSTSSDASMQTGEAPSTDTSSSGDGSGHTGAQSHDSSSLDSLFEQAGQAYNSGDYGTAVTLGKQILDQSSGADWGRAAYGLVMSYDMNNQIDKACDLMKKVYDHVAASGHPNPQNYWQQYQTYVNGQHWQGEFLLW